MVKISAMKSKKNYPAINVLNVMRGFQNPKLPHRITPYRFETHDGQTHKVARIRQSTTQRVGQGHHYHYVLKTEESRYFHIVFDSNTLTWRLVQEVDEQLFFNE